MPIDGSLDNFFQLIFFYLAANRMASCDCALHVESPIRSEHFGRCSDTAVSTIATFPGCPFTIPLTSVARARVVHQVGKCMKIGPFRDRQSTRWFIVSGALDARRGIDCWTHRISDRWTANYEPYRSVWSTAELNWQPQNSWGNYSQTRRRKQSNTMEMYSQHCARFRALRWPNTKKIPLCWSSSYNRTNVVWSLYYSFPPLNCLCP